MGVGCGRVFNDDFGGWAMILTRRGFRAGSGAALCTSALQAATPDLLQIEGPAFGARWRVRAAMGTEAAAVARARSLTHISEPHDPGLDI